MTSTGTPGEGSKASSPARIHLGCTSHLNYLSLEPNPPPLSILVLDELDFLTQIPTALAEIYTLAHRHPASLCLIRISDTMNLGS